MKVVITPATAKEVVESLSVLIKEALDQDVDYKSEGHYEGGLYYNVTSSFNVNTKLVALDVWVGNSHVIKKSFPGKSHPNLKSNRGISIGVMIGSLETLVKDELFDFIFDNTDFNDKLLDVIEGTSFVPKVETPFGIEVCCAVDDDSRVYQLTKNGVQVYAFEEAVNLEAGGEFAMLRPLNDLIHFTHAVLKRTFNEGSFTAIELELEEEEA